MKKIFAILMIVMMVVCFMPSMAFAVDGTNENSDSGIVFTKTAVQNNDGSVEITLKAYTTSTTVTSTSSKPVDMVLVLDQSGSMADGFGEGSRQAAMKSAVKSFIDKIDPNGEHRVSVVTFGSDAANYVEWTNADETGKPGLIKKIDKLPDSPKGATNVAAGMNNAASLLTSSKAGSKKVVIVFTDGVPTTSDEFSTSVADNAIAAAKGMKDAGAKVYTIGIFNGADPSQMYGAEGFDTNSNGTVGSEWKEEKWGLFPDTDFPKTDVPAGNRFLNLLSSNYKDASKIGLTRTTFGLGILHYGIKYEITENFDRSDSKYYLTASDAAGLSNVFEKIQSETMVPAIELDASTVIRDGISAYFNAPAATDVKVYTAAYNGTSFDETSLADITSDVTAGVSADKKVTVTGFNFNDNYISSEKRENDFYGKELIIKFTVTPDYAAIDKALENGSLTRNADGTDYKVPTNTDAQILKETEVVAAADGQYASMHAVTYQIAGKKAPYKVQLRAAGAQVQKEADLAAHTAWTSEQIAATDINISGYFTMPNQDVLFTCEKNTPVVPDKPNATDINGLAGKVQVECETKTTEHAEALYELTDFVIGEVQGTEGNYYVTLTVPAAPYVAKYVKVYGEHKQVATDPVSGELKATYDGQNWRINDADKIVFHVECSTSDPNPDKPPVYPTHYYTVKWNNYDNTNLETDYCTYYQMPTYDSATPVRPADEKYTYEFIGWDKEVVRVTGDAVYTAQFKAVAKEQPKPEDPADPTNPDKPGRPDKPTKPDKPEKPAKPDKPDTEVPKTGDTSVDNMIINLFLLTSSALAAALLWYRKYARK